MSSNSRRLVAGALLSLSLVPGASRAADLVRVGYAAQSPTFIAPIETGNEQGYFAKAGIEITATTFGGGAKLHQAMVSGAVDIGLGTGSDFAFLVKGSPEKAAFLVVNQPYSIGLSVINPAIKTPDDLKNRKIGVTSTGAYTYWFASELPHFLNWPANVTVTPVSVGGALSGQLAALTTGQIDGVVTDITLGLQLQKEHRGRLLINAADLVHDVVTSLVWAHNDMIANHPDELRRTILALRQSIDYLVAHQDYQEALVARETGTAPDVVHDYVQITNPGWSKDGRISKAALSATAVALVQSGLLTEVPDLTPFYTEAFLPK